MMKAVSFNITDVEYLAVRSLVMRGRHISMSAAFRAALRLWLQTIKIEPGIMEKIRAAEAKVRVRRRSANLLEEMGDSIHGP